jgi:toxin CptA
MSTIAVSATVKPSRRLLAMTIVMCLIAAYIAYFISSSESIRLPSSFRIPLSLACAAAVFLAFFSTAHHRKTFRLDISGIGIIRLMEYREGPLGQETSGRGQVMQLLPDSSLWPGCLILRLRDEHQKVVTLLILKDSLSAPSYRAVSVACRWIAEQNGRLDDTKI